MKIELTVKREVDVTHLQVNAGVRYWCDATVNGIKGNDDDYNDDLGIPCREGGIWRPRINVDSGKIENWTHGTTASVHYKVVDCCGWELIDSDGNVVSSAEDGYVPKTLCPKRNGYGDYIIMDIGADGTIDGWSFDSSEFESDSD